MWFSNVKDQQYSLKNDYQDLLLIDLLMICLLNSLCLLLTVWFFLYGYKMDPPQFPCRNISKNLIFW